MTPPRALCRLVLAGLFAGTAPMVLAEEVPDLPPDLAGEGMPQVLTPARLAQAQTDVAASVTILDREMIAALGARDVPELLRLVPGMMVTQINGSEWSVNYHGTNLRDIRRMQVLVDGMSVYQPGLARVLWSDLALSIDDIERIEITRGPNAAAYGANAFTGIVNIITIHPQDTTDQQVRVTAGNRDTVDSYGHAAGHSPRADWRLSFSTKSDSGYDTEKDGSEYRDDRHLGIVNWRSEFRPGDSDRVEVIAGAKQGANELQAKDQGVYTRFEDKPVADVDNSDLMLRWTRDVSANHAFHVQVYGQETDTRNRWRSCLDPILLSTELATLYQADPDAALGLLDAAANPADIPAYIAGLDPSLQPLAMAVVTTYMGFQMGGYTEVCGDQNLDVHEARVDAEFQDTLSIGDAIRLVSGVAARRDTGSSESYVGPGIERHNDVWRVFGHGEFRVAPTVVLNLGATLEDDDISGRNVSPRAGVNWRFAERQSLRVVSSRAVRTQDIYEEYANLSMTFRDLAPAWPGTGETRRTFFMTQQSPGNLVPEDITSWEVGYFGFFPDIRTETDVRVFREKLNHLVSKPANLFEFNVDNDSRTDLNGFEWQAKYSMAPGSFLWATYAYIDNDSTVWGEARFTAQESGSLALSHRFTEGWNASAAWYQTRHQNFRRGQWNSFRRLDLRLAHDMKVGRRGSLELAANTQTTFDDEPTITGDQAYNDRIYGYFSARLSY